MNFPLIPPKPVWLAFLLHTGIVFAAAEFSDLVPYHDPTGFINPFLPSVNSFFDKWIRWDAHWYTYVAQFGYTEQSIVFFPSILLFIKAIAKMGLSYASAGLLLCNLFTFLSFWLLYAVLKLDFSSAQSQRAILAFGLFPTSFFLNSIYTEPLFLAFSLACVYFSRSGRWWQAGFFAMAAALTRNLGVFLTIFMLMEGWKERSRRKSFFYALFLPPLALSLFSVYNWYLTGDPLAFAHAQQGWGRYFSYPWMSYWRNLILIKSAFPLIEPGVILDAIIVLLTLCCLLWATLLNRIRTSYLILAWLWFFIPLCSTSDWFPLYSLSRFVLILFPLYTLCLPLRRPYFHGFLILSALLLVLSTLYFVNWYWIG